MPSEVFTDFAPIEDRFREPGELDAEVRAIQMCGALEFRKRFRQTTRKLKRDYLTQEETEEILMDLGVVSDMDSARSTLDSMVGKNILYGYSCISDGGNECYFHLDRLEDLSENVAYKMRVITPWP